MADGTRKPIENVNRGDKVLATDPTTGRSAARPVTDTIVGADTKNLVQITVDTDGERGTKTGVVIATDNHPFWSPTHKQWRTAGQLQPGMWLRTSAGTHVQITAINTRTQHQRVHNLTVDRTHTYYVQAGTASVLVHNCGTGGVSLTKRFASKDQYVRQVATAIEDRYPGHVLGVNVDALRPNGTLATDFDIETMNAVIQVKAGSAKRIVGQADRTALVTNKPVIAYIPDAGHGVVRAVNRAGHVATKDLGDLLDVLAP